MSDRRALLLGALLGALIGLLGLPALAPSSASAWCRMTTSLRAPSLSMPCVLPGPGDSYLQWRQRCHTLVLSSSLSRDLSEADERDIIQRSYRPWLEVTCGGEAPGFQIQMLAEHTSCEEAFYRTGDGGNSNVIAFVEDWDSRSYDGAAYAVTIVWHNTNTGEILNVDMEINENRGPYGSCPAVGGCVGGRTVDLQNVLTHEFGHFLGLAHTPDDPEATMFASAEVGEVGKRTLEADDIEGFCEVYGPENRNFYESCDYEPPGGLNLSCAQSSGDCSVHSVHPPSSSEGGKGEPLVALGLLAALGLLLARRRR